MKKALHVNSGAITFKSKHGGHHFCSDFQGVLEGFQRFCLDFMGFCPDFHHIKTFADSEAKKFVREGPVNGVVSH